MSRNAIRTAFGAVLLAFLALPAIAGSGSGDVRKPVLLVDVPQLAQCRGLLTQALFDRVVAATEDPGATFEKMRRGRHSMMEAPPWVECESKLWKSLNRKTGLFNVTPQSSGPLGLQSPDPAAEAMVRSLAASVGDNIDPDGGVGDYQGEMQIAVNQKNPQQLTAAANTFFQDANVNCASPDGGVAGTLGTQALYGSNDGGNTWKYNCAPWPPSLTGASGAEFYFGSDPAVAWDSQGHAYAAYMLLAYGYDFSTAIVVARSSDAGQTWSPLGVVVNDLASGALFDDKEMMAVDNSAGPPSAKSHPGRLYVVWDQNNIERIAHSDDGVTWTPVVLPTPGFGLYDIGSDVKVGADGTVYVIWNRLIYTSGQSGEKMVFSKSVDGGNTWSAPVVVVSTALFSFGGNNNPPAQDYRGVNAFGSLDVDRNPASPFFGSLYAAYCDFPAGTTSGTDLNSYVVRSTDGGATWSLPVKTNDDSGTASQFFPWLSVDQSDGTVNVSWYDTRLDPNNRKTQIFYARSSNGAVSFEPNLLVTDSGALGWRNAVNYSDENYNFDNFGSNANQYGDYGGCVAANRQVHPFWADSRQFYPNADTVSPTRLEDAATATIVNCSAPAAVTTPLVATACSSPRVQISWNAPSTWGTNATGGTYSVYRSTTGAFAGSTSIATGLTGSTFDDTTGFPGWSYTYFVVAKNNCPGTPLTPMSSVPTSSAAIVFPLCGATLGTLSGTVTTNGIPVAGATITAGAYSAIADAVGGYTIAPMVTGTYNVSVAAAGYDPAAQNNVVINTSATTTQNFALSPTPTAACFTDTTQADFQAGSTTNTDVTTAPGSVKLSTSAPGVFQSSGSFTSSVKDSGAVVAGAAMTWTTLSWSATTPAGTSVKFQVAASNSAAGPFSFVGPDGTAATFFTTSGASLAQFNGRRYLQYTAYLGTTDPSVTPSLDSVTICDQVNVCSGTAVPAITPSATQVCPYSAGKTATGSAGAIAYAWSIVNGTITGGANAQTVTFTAGPSGTTTLFLTATAPSGCTAGSSAGITITTTTPSPSITAGGPTTFCPGGSVLLTSSSGSANQWYLDGVAIAGAVNPTYTATAAGNYTVTFTQGGCASFPSAPLTVTHSPQNAAPTVTALGPTSFCAGGSVKLTSSALADNQWFLDGSPIAGATATSYLATASGSYTVSSTPAGACSGLLSTPVVVIVTPYPATPAITPGGPTTICYPGSVTLTSSSATGNQWYYGPYKISGATGQTYVANFTASFTVVVTSNGCSAVSAPVTVSVNYPNTPYVYTSGPTSFCIGGSVTLTSSQSTNIQWYKDGSPIADATNATYSATTSGSYTVATTVTGCAATSIPIIVTASNPPATPAITPGGSTTLCNGNYVILSSSSATGNQWYLNGSPYYANGQSIPAFSAGDYTVTTAPNGCPSAPSAPVTVTVLPQPTPATITAGGSTTFCAGGSVTLTSSSATGYQWSVNGNLIPGATSQSYVATGSGYYYVTVIQNGCNSYASNYITVNANTSGPAAPTITPGGSTTLCDNATITLTSSSSSGNQWFLNGSAIPGATGQTYVASAGGSYTLQYTNGSSCASALSAPLVLTTGTKPAAPSISAGGVTTFCAGGSVTLTSSSSANNLWYRNGLLIANATASSYVASTSGSYTVIASNNGCNSAPSAEVTVTATPYPAPPVITPAGSVTSCSADPPLQLTTNNATGNQWYNHGFAIANATGQAYIVTQPGIYTVGSINNGCDGGKSAPTTVTFATSPAPASITAGGPTTFCSSNPTTLTSSSTTGNQWLRNGTPVANATGQSYIPTASGYYTVQMTSGSCAVTSLGISITVTAAPPQPSITTSGPTTFCGDTISGVTLTSSNSSGNQWYRDGGAIDGATGVSYHPLVAGSYTVQTAGNGCVSQTSSPSVITSVGLSGVTPVISAPSGLYGCTSVLLTSNHFAGNQWFLNGVAISGATGNNYTATASGNYSVQLSSGSCSSLMSSTLPVQIATVTPPPKPVVTATGGTTMCTPGSVTLHTTMTGVSLEWFRDGINLFWGADSYVATVAGSYQVRYTTSTSCGVVTVYSDPVFVTASPTPVVTLTTASSVVTGTNGTASVTPVAGASYQWTITDGTFIGSATGTNVSFTAGTLGNMTLKATITNAAGCVASKSVIVPVTPIPGQEKFDPNGDVTIDPADVFYLVNYLFTSGPAPKGAGGPVASGDANGDGIVDPADVFFLVSYLFNSGPHPYSHLAGTSVGSPAGDATTTAPLSGRVSLGTPRLRDGHYVVPVLVSTGSGTAQAVSVKVHIAGITGGATIHRAAALADLTPAFETTRESGNVVSYIASFGAGSHLDGVVAEVELDAPRGGNVRLTLDAAVTMLSNAQGTVTASTGNGKLALEGTTITAPPHSRDRALDRRSN